MKKLVLFAAVAAMVAFASCAGEEKKECGKECPEAAATEVVAEEAPVVEEAVVAEEAPVAEETEAVEEVVEEVAE